MRTKKRIIIISVIIIIICISVYSYFVFNYDGIVSENIVEWIKTVFSGMLASAIVTLFVYTGEYYSERRNSIEQFCELNYNLIHHFRNIRCYDSDIGKDAKLLNEALLQYKTLAEAEYHNGISNAYGNLDFILSNKKIRDDLAYNRIYKKQREMELRLIELKYHIEKYEEYGNTQVIVDKILETKTSKR